MTGPGELVGGAVSSHLVQTLPCSPAVPQQISHFHFPREATRPNKPEQGLSMRTRASLICCLVSSFTCVWGKRRLLLRGLRPDPAFEEKKIGRESVHLRICAWASHQPFLFEADLWKASRLPCLVSTNSNHTRNLPLCQVQFFNVPLQGHSVSL